MTHQDLGQYGIHIVFLPAAATSGKLVDAELRFTAGPLDGLKLIGFGIWERRGGAGRNVTFPARQYSVNGERRSFALLRPALDAGAQNTLRDLILEEYQLWENAPDGSPRCTVPRP